jgi:hypothetical protein
VRELDAAVRVPPNGVSETPQHAGDRGVHELGAVAEPATPIEGSERPLRPLYAGRLAVEKGIDVSLTADGLQAGGVERRLRQEAGCPRTPSEPRPTSSGRSVWSSGTRTIRRFSSGLGLGNESGSGQNHAVGRGIRPVALCALRGRPGQRRWPRAESDPRRPLRGYRQPHVPGRRNDCGMGDRSQGDTSRDAV